MKSQTLAVPGHVRVKKDSAVNGLSIMLCKHESCKRPECVAAFAVRINNPCYEDKQNLLTITGFCTGHCHVNLCLPLQCCTGILLILGTFRSTAPSFGGCLYTCTVWWGTGGVKWNFSTLDAASWGCCHLLQFPVSAQLFRKYIWNLAWPAWDWPWGISHLALVPPLHGNSREN